MKMNFKRILSFAVALAMILGMFPTLEHHAHAAVSGSLDNTSIGLSNSNGTWSASGTQVSGSVKGTWLFGSYLGAEATLTITNNMSETATLAFDYEAYFSESGESYLKIDEGLESAVNIQSSSEGETVTGSYIRELDAGASVTIRLIAGKRSGDNTTTLTLTNVQLFVANTVTTTFGVPENGSYTVDGVSVSAEDAVEAEAGTAYALVATPASGYQFLYWYNETNGAYLSSSATYTYTAAEDAKIVPKFALATDALFGVGSITFNDLNEANAYTNSGSEKTIVLLNDGILPAGDYTISSGVTLLIPYDDANTAHGASASCTSYSSILNDDGHVAWESPTPYRTLTLAADAKITVNGNIEVGGQHAAAGGKTGMYGGSPTAELGYINMLSGSHIELNSGANLYCWGYVYGDGTITANSGAAIYENFQIMDFRGGSVTTSLASEYKVFPLSQYYVQNVEVATRYNYGATEYIATSIFMSNQCFSATVKFIGEGAMFQPEEGAYFVKDYNPATDTLDMHAYGDSTLGSMNMELAGNAIDSSDFVLPITNNIRIYLHSGTTTLEQNVMMLPGSSLTIDEGATLNLAYTDTTGEVVTTGGYVLQIFDSENWTQGLNVDTLENTTDLRFVHPSMQFRAVGYTCTTRKTRTAEDLTDVTVDINGTIICNGFLYSTVTWVDPANEDYSIQSGGANIISSSKTGVVTMINGAGQDKLTMMYDQEKAAYYYIPIASVQLKNGDGTLLDTTGAVAGTTYNYCATHDCWYTGSCAQCSVTVTWMNGSTQLGTSEVANGAVPSYTGATPTKDSDASYHYTFAGWSTTNGGEVLSELPAITENTTFYAVFTAEAHSGTDDGDCTSAVTCSCGYVITAAKDHVDANKDHACDECGGDVGEHVDSDKDHVCDYGCGESIGTHEDANKDHTCDYGCSEAIGTCEDADLDHACDYGCGQSYGTCEDTDKDHACDYGCGQSYGTCEDTDKDHACDYGCGQSYGTCEDTDKDHTCDYGCGKSYGTCEDSDKDHACDYGCEKVYGTCEDSDKDHACDYGCGKSYGTCEDTDKNHECDYGCGKSYGTCEDTDKDHTCDYGCGQSYGTCEDTDKDHTCDYGCGQSYGTCEDADKDHTCDYGCGQSYGTCEDTDKDHTCDYGCGQSYGTCEDANLDHACDYGCEKVYGTCEDSDKDHACDYGCGKSYGTCEDTDKNHECDYGCGKSYGTCEDTDKDHACDYGCEKVYGTCEDSDKDHACDYGCGKSYGTCEDTDKDHTCDYGCGKSYGTCEDTDKDHACDYGCGKSYGTCEDTDKDHTCDYGCGKSYGTCEDTDKDHACDYGCDKVHGTHADSDKDHACDYGCAESIGTHADSNLDHKCDYGCSVAIGACVDSDKDHYCDYGAESETGCRQYFGTHADGEDTNHLCDYGCGETADEGCYDADNDGDHKCDECAAVNVTICGDSDKDHKCDTDSICNAYSTGDNAHADSDKDHECDYGCAESIGECKDSDKDHDCDYGCDMVFGDCTDSENDGDHVCDYGCGKTLTTCGDEGKDHICDSDSACTVYSTGSNACADKDGDGDHVCDYGCGEIKNTCGDEGKDHKCDTDSACTVYSTGDNACADKDGDGDHVCDYGCGKTLTTCVDSNKDHICDSDSVCNAYSTGDYACADKDGDGDHVCDYGCGKVWSACSDADNDGNHKCDECDVDNVTDHSYNSVVTPPTCTDKGYTTHTCSECGDEYTDTLTDANGHSYQAVVTPPTCTVGGYTTYTCSVCGDTYTADETAAEGHTYGDVTFNWNADNTECTATHTCSCGYSETEKVTSTSAITTVATCVTNQVTTYTAEFTAEWVENKTQTKDVTGEKDADNHEEACEYTDNGDGTHTKTYPCCNKSLSENHSYVDGKCACDKVQTFTITWVNGDTTKNTTVEYGKVPVSPYADSDYTKAADINYHYSFAGWSDTADGTAAELANAYANVTYYAVYSGTEHDYSSNCKICSVCSYSGDSSREHTAGNPTCTEDAVCTVCGTTVQEAYGHLYTYNSSESYWSTDEDGNHVYHFVATCTRENNCHEKEEVAVTAVQQMEGYTEPTCTADGSANYVATISSDTTKSWVMKLITDGNDTVSKVFTIDKLGHTLTETKAQAATCTEDGTLGYYTCDRCSEVFTDADAATITTVAARKIAALGHVWKCTTDGTIICNRGGCTATTTEYVESAHTWVSEGETAATCTKAGEHAGRKCSVCGIEEGGGEIQALGHSYGETSYAWTQDETTGQWSCSAKHSCTRDGCTETETGHTETVDATVTSAVVIAATCTEKGSTKYSAIFDVSWAVAQVEVKQDVALAAHTPDEGIITTSPFYNKEGVRTFYCTACGAETGTAVEPATGVINIAVLGDSITAFENYSNGTAAETTNSTLAGGRVWFPMTDRLYDSEGNPIELGTGEITAAEHIWIYKAAASLGANILVNNSWSGSAVNFWQYGAPGMWEDRVVQLHDNTGTNSGQEPDIIVVYMGTNDFKYTELVNGTYAQLEDGSYYQSVLGSFEEVDFDTLITENGDGTFTYAEPLNTMEAYAISFHKMQHRYPNSEIYVMTLLPFRAGHTQPTEFNEDLRQMAEHFGLCVVDIEDTGIEADAKSFEYLMEDWLHPNIAGMEVLANAFESAVRNNSELFADKYVNVEYELDGVTSMEGTTRTAIVGEAFETNLKLKDTSLIMQVTVTRNGVDITDSCMSVVEDTKFGGTMVNIKIDSVAEGDVIVITAKAHGHEYTSEVTQPTCTEAGYTTYTCECGASYKANEVDALGHSYTMLSDKVATEATCTVNAFYYAECERCADVHESQTLEAENTKLGHSYTTKASVTLFSEATCTDPARYYVQCDRCDAESADKTVAVGEALGHSYADATYEWQYDATNKVWICTAKHVCANDSSHVETATATVSGEVTTAATCTTKGWTTYTATFDVDWAVAQTKNVEDVAALGHEYGETTYEWSNGNGNCTAKRACSRDNCSHYETSAATVTSEVVTEATCTEKGLRRYTAIFVVDWAATQTADEEISAKGHTEVVDAAVAPTCTGTGLTEGKHCSVCNTVLTAQTVVDALGHDEVAHEAKDPTCTGIGWDAYVTCSRCDYTTYSEKEATGHSMSKTDAADPTCTATGNYEYYTCETCGKVFKDADGESETTVEQETIAATRHDIATVVAKAATCTDIGWDAYEYCKKCDYTTYNELPAIGHKDENTDHICDNGCGVYQGEHSDGDDADHLCDYNCGKIADEGCYDTDPKDHKCDECGNVISECSGDTVKFSWDLVTREGSAYWICDICGQKHYIETATSSEYVPGNCSVKEQTIYTATASHNGSVRTTTMTVVGNYGDHSMGDVKFTWNLLTKEGTAYRECQICSEREYFETVTESTEYAGNCVTQARVVYVATATVDGESYSSTYVAMGSVDSDNHLDENFDHVCDYGCGETIGTCEDTDKDHTCDYGCGKVYGTCEDTDKDHACDYGCGKVYGTCEDADMDHACDYGCEKVYGTCEDSDKDHSCDYGCEKVYGEHTDSADDEDHICDYCYSEEVLEDCSDKTGDGDHNCDICGEEAVTGHAYADADCELPATCTECGQTTGSALGHIDENLDHICDRNCGKECGTCEDADLDHACDYGCEKVYGTCEDADLDHACDYGCEKVYGTCEDADLDHACDYGCEKVYGTCEDADLDHACDYGCEKVYGTCEDADLDHACDYGCEKVYGTCEDADLDHACDYGCEKVYGTCEDSDKDHACDYGCEKVYGTCEDADLDHACDYGCEKVYGTCEDADLDHACDYGCEKVYGTCEDSDKDHTCDYGCEKVYGTCEDSDKDHSCDYGCEKVYGEHTDSADDEDHICDYCYSEEVLEDCSDKTGDGDHNCDICGEEAVTDHAYADADCELPATCTECGQATGSALGHIDENLDHICDRNCGKECGTCEDADLDHACDYGCEKVYGICEDSDKDHACDYGCEKVYGEHTDSTDDEDHICDYCYSEEVLEDCSDKTGDGDHNCDICGEEGYTACFDSTIDDDHLCDECALALSECADEDGDGDHACDACGKEEITACYGGEATCLNMAICDECGSYHGQIDPDNHASDNVYAENNSDGTHTNYHECCDSAINTVSHSYTNGMCACGDIQIYTVVIMNGSEIWQTVEVSHGEELIIAELLVPTKDGYTFAGWVYADGTAVEEKVTVTSDELEIYADWTLNVSIYYEITWVVDGMVIKQEIAYTTVPVYGLGFDPVKTGDDTIHYLFAGWALTENGEVLEALPVVTGEATYYAVFVPGEHADAQTVDHKCDECGYVMSACDDSLTDEDHLCDICGKQLNSCLDVEGMDHKCDICAQTMTECMDEDMDHICDWCGETASGCEDYLQKTGEEPAGCTESGSISYICTYCGKEHVQTVEPTGHTPGEAVVENQVYPGYDLVCYCTVCGEEVSREYVLDVMRGDLDADGDVDGDDAIYMLRHVHHPERYKLNQDGDFNGDGKVDGDDAIHLLRYVHHPDRYPLHPLKDEE